MNRSSSRGSIAPSCCAMFSGVPAASSTSLDEEYAREVRIAQTHGNAPAGQFAQAAKDTDTAALRKWIAQASKAGVNDFADGKTFGSGAPTSSPTPPRFSLRSSLTAEVHRRDGTTVTRRVSLYGTIHGVSPAAGAAINCVLHKTIKSKDFLPAFLNAIVLAAVGTKLPEKFRAIVIGTQSEKLTEFTREFRPMDRDSAIAYLTQRRQRSALDRQRILPADRSGRASRQGIAEDRE